MKNKIKHITYLLLPIVTFLFIFSGCGSSKITPIVTINDDKLYLDDFLYDIYLIEKDGNQLEEDYQKQLGYSYWDAAYNGLTAREAAKSSILTGVVMYEILSDSARQNGIELSEEELIANEETVNNILKEASEEYMLTEGMPYEALKKSLDKKTLGDKYRTKLIKSYKIDEAAIKKDLNPEDYREYKTECLLIRTVTTQDKKLVPLEETAKASAYSAISDALELLAEGADIDTITNNNKNLIYDTRDFIYGDKGYEEAYETAAIALENNEYSPVITTEYGYYIIYMLDNNSPESYERAIKDAITAKEDEQFAAEYNKIKAQYDITINFDYWNTVTIGQVFK